MHQNLHLATKEPLMVCFMNYFEPMEADYEIYRKKKTDSLISFQRQRRWRYYQYVQKTLCVQINSAQGFNHSGRRGDNQTPSRQYQSGHSKFFRELYKYKKA